jgi:hypothetical protein
MIADHQYEAYFASKKRSLLVKLLAPFHQRHLLADSTADLSSFRVNFFRLRHSPSNHGDFGRDQMKTDLHRT